MNDKTSGEGTNIVRILEEVFKPNKSGTNCDILVFNYAGEKDVVTTDRSQKQ